MSIDTIFYGRSYNKIFSDINRILKDNGLLVFITSEQNDMEKSLINYFNYEKYDYTEDCFNIMKLKNRIMKKYGKEFERESNSFIWHQYIEESIDESVEVIPKDFSRFIYKATKKL
jgi:tRNA G46 methylase TrmB